MRRLYLQIYAAFLCIVVLFGVLGAAAWLLGGRGRHDAHLLAALASLASDSLAPADRPVPEAEASLQRLSRRLGLNLALYAGDGGRLAAVGSGLPAPQKEWSRSRWVPTRAGPGLALRLDDGRWLMAGQTHRGAHVARGVVSLLVLALVVAAGAYPVARRITRRLERLQQRVDALGGGNLSARVDVEGRDEVADLARSFNLAAERIERLVASQRSMLAGASHELRSPLARIRLAAELLARQPTPELAERVSRDVAELDELVSELLLASRLQTLSRLDRVEVVDLLALLAEESARSGAEASGAPAQVDGDPRMLRRMVRNLLDNARRYGSGSPVEGSVATAGPTALLRVMDRGPGVPVAERERIFEPFYRPAGWREDEEGGVGLGLALVRQIARHHGGEARFLPREGGGSCFEITLPLSGAATDRSA